MEWIRDDFLLTDDVGRVYPDVVHQLLRDTYWGDRRSRDVVGRIVKTSLCFS